MTAVPCVESFYHADSGTFAYVVSDPGSKAAAVIDAVLDFDTVTGRTCTNFADRICDWVEQQDLTVEWILETHVHADHISGAPAVRKRLGGKIAVGRRIDEVRAAFRDAFGYEKIVLPGREGFDHFFADGETFALGGLEARYIATPGHTPACGTYVIGDAAFVGDTIFQPDMGTARCDFPGGDARTLYRSIRKLLDTLPAETRIFVCHDYGAAANRDPRAETSVAEERRKNIHARDGVSEDEFVEMREARDATLGLPRLMLPSVQLNVRGGQPPEPDETGVRRITIPLDYF